MFCDVVCSIYEERGTDTCRDIRVDSTHCVAIWKRKMRQWITLMIMIAASMIIAVQKTNILPLRSKCTRMMEV